MRTSIFCRVSTVGLALYWLYQDCIRARSLRASAEMFWIATDSAGLSCLPVSSVGPSAAMFSAIWVRTGKSARATLIHCALHPVAAKEMLNTMASMIWLVDRVIDLAVKDLAVKELVIEF